MKHLFLIGLIIAGLSVAAIAQSQETTTTKKSTTTTTTTADQDATSPANSTATSDTHSNVRTLTGCIQKGEDTNEYDLVGQDGSTWELKSDAIDLASHVGHTVTITGAVAHPGMHGMKEDTKREAQEHGMDKSATEHGHLTVTDLQMVSSSCTPSR